MQMGRWFGYRPGYSDLVRLYIGRSELIGKNTIDLCRAFEAMCRDEEDFRAQLKMYEGKGGVTPKQVPALVFNSHPRLRPTSRNKMFKARITWAAFDYREPTSQSANKSGRAHNAELFAKLISKLQIKTAKVDAAESRSRSFTVNWGLASNSDIISVLSKVQWEKSGNPIGAEIAFLNLKPAPIDSWLLLAPQITRGHAPPWSVANREFQCVARTRDHASGRFGVYSSPDHLNFAKWLVGETDPAFNSPLKPRERTGILLFYPTRELLSEQAVATGDPVMGFGILMPNFSTRQPRIAYSV